MSKKKEEVVERKEPEAVDSFGDFEMLNQGKYDRAVAAVGSDEDKLAILVEYDRLGGFIRHNGAKVVTGSFWNFKDKKRQENPQPKVLRRQAAFVEETVEVVEVVEAPKRGRKAKEDETE